MRRNLKISITAFCFLLLNVFSVSAQKVYEVDTGKSKIDWICGNHNGFIRLHIGELVMKDGNITKGTFKVDMDSIVNLDIDYELMRKTLENLLRSADYFNAEKYPYSIFEIYKVQHIKDDEYCVSGDLKIMDQTHSINFHANINTRDGRLTAESEKFFIDRTKWGITTSSAKYAKSEESFTFSDEIYFIVHLVAYKK